MKKKYHVPLSRIWVWYWTRY